MSEALTWALVVATYKRAHVLPRCVRLACAQTRPPIEIVIVDASPEWEATRATIEAAVHESGRGVRLDYAPAERPSSTAQRNQGVRRSTADVLFLIDDDSLMYPDCAEEVMRVYDADVGGCVAGVSPVNAPAPPDESSGHGAASAARPSTGALRRAVRAALRADDIFVPYDRDYPSHRLPPEVASLDVSTIPCMHGARMTFRRGMIEREPFDEVLERYAAGEDSDTSYRVSRHGALLNAHRARLCHLEAGGGRLSRYTVAALGALNPTVLHRIYGVDQERSRSRTRSLLRRRLAIQLCKDLVNRSWSLPHARGIALALRHVDAIFAKDVADLRRWYPGFQKELIERDRGRV